MSSDDKGAEMVEAKRPDEVIARMEVDEVPEEGGIVKLSCVYEDDPTIPERKAFTDATPWGEASYQIDSPYAREFFAHAKAIGRDVHVTFRLVPEGE